MMVMTLMLPEESDLEQEDSETSMTEDEEQ